MSIIPNRHAVILQLSPVVELDDEALLALCERNRELRIERNSTGELVIMSPAGGKTSDRNAEINMQLRQWARRDRRGRVFDSSGGFLLPSGAVRSPDASWVLRERLREISDEQKERFLPLCPDFVIELRSPSDPIQVLVGKMEEYLDAGARLAWLIDPLDRSVRIFRPGQAVEEIDQPASLSGETVLDGFVMEMEEIWDPSW